MAERTVIAIDGPSGSGKSTVARRVAEVLGYRYLDSGAMYRALALAALRRGIAADDEPALARLLARIEIALSEEAVRLDGEDVSREIRTPEVSRFVSRVAAVPAVRAGMVAKQRTAHSGEDLVVEGRDIGSVVFPDAEVKVFLTASPEERARRRAKETEQPLEEVLRELGERDERDSTREHSPLTKAEDAFEFDTTELSVEEVVRRLAERIREALAST